MIPFILPSLLLLAPFHPRLHCPSQPSNACKLPSLAWCNIMMTTTRNGWVNCPRGGGSWRAQKMASKAQPLQKFYSDSIGLSAWRVIPWEMHSQAVEIIQTLRYRLNPPFNCAQSKSYRSAWGVLGTEGQVSQWNTGLSHLAIRCTFVLSHRITIHDFQSMSIMIYGSCFAIKKGPIVRHRAWPHMQQLPPKWCPSFTSRNLLNKACRDQTGSKANPSTKTPTKHLH